MPGAHTLSLPGKAFGPQGFGSPLPMWQRQVTTYMN